MGVVDVAGTCDRWAKVISKTVIVGTLVHASFLLPLVRVMAAQMYSIGSRLVAAKQSHESLTRPPCTNNVNHYLC